MECLRSKILHRFCGFLSTPLLEAGLPHNSVKRMVCYIRLKGILSTGIRRDGTHCPQAQASSEPVWLSKLFGALTRGINNG